MQYYLDQAEQQHKQEQHDAELQVQALNEALSRAQAKLQEVGSRTGGALVAKQTCRSSNIQSDQSLAQ